MKIYKYPIYNYGITILDLLVGSKVLSVGVQNNEIVLWIATNVEAGNLRETFIFHSIYTGDNVNISYKFIDSVMLNNNRTVVHVFKL